MTREDERPESGGIRVLIIDEQPVARAGLRAMLERSGDIDVVGEAADEVEAASLGARLSPDVVIMDVSSSHGEGLELLAKLANCPATGARMLVLTNTDDPTCVLGSLMAGASGYVLKRSSGEEIAAAVRNVRAGRMPIDASVTSSLIASFVDFTSVRAPRCLSTSEPLSPREEEIVLRLVKGANTAEVACELHLSQTTIKTHIAHILAKWGVRDRIQLVAKAFETGFVHVRQDPA